MYISKSVTFFFFFQPFFFLWKSCLSVFFSWPPHSPQLQATRATTEVHRLQSTFVASGPPIVALQFCPRDLCGLICMRWQKPCGVIEQTLIWSEVIPPKLLQLGCHWSYSVMASHSVSVRDTKTIFYMESHQRIAIDFFSFFFFSGNLKLSAYEPHTQPGFHFHYLGKAFNVEITKKTVASTIIWN